MLLTNVARILLGWPYNRLDSEQLKQLRLQLCPAHHADIRQYFLSIGRRQMLPFLAGLRSKSSLEAHFSLPVQEYLILFELSFKPEIGADIWPSLSDEANSLFEPPAFLLHQVSDD